MVDTIIGKIFKGTPFAIEASPNPDDDGSWGSTKISIFRNKVLIGEYLRNYPSFGSDTFFPFEIDNQWYALYSTSYTGTRVMKLNDTNIEDWCGDDPEADGFCPTAYYIPRYFHYEKEIKIDCDFPTPEEYTSEDFTTSYPLYAFLSGCYWGDDSSWKLMFVDLSKVPDKILSITDKFGYWELPPKPLSECITIRAMKNYSPVLYILKEEMFRLD